MREMKEKEEIFEGKWYTHPPMRNALIAGLLSGIAFVLTHLEMETSDVQN